MPQGYQITQHWNPLATGGHIMLYHKDGTSSKVRLERLQLEQDSGKSLYDQHPDSTCVDLNRAGVGLMEIVTEPDMRHPQEASAFLAALQTLLSHIRTCDGSLEEGSMRCDVNVSVRRPGEPFGVRCEIKNMNSMKHIYRAIEHEADRHIEMIERGETLIQETRGFDAASGRTYRMRSKESQVDYRFMPEPDLLPLTLAPEHVEHIRATMPELPDAMIKRYANDYGLGKYESTVLLEHQGASKYFEDVVKAGGGSNPKQACHWVISELFGLLAERSLDIKATPVQAAQLGSLLDLIGKDVISGRIGKDVIELMMDGESAGKTAQQIVDEKGWTQISGDGQLTDVCREVIQENPAQVAEYLGGRDRLMRHFVGQVMKKTSGRAKPPKVTDIFLTLFKDGEGGGAKE
eukprot:TRINITY_DN3829_c1_g3_i1.p1 TRINITY_DN3829_c1_g3~~TRINITY_DN3829_c1_g3_i1.p1  ORF type:complete len:405 (-),score=88.02 TRINITY_DN3829_c1_g3_i1:6-1220(-)